MYILYSLAQLSPPFPGFDHKFTEDSLRIDGSCTSCQAPEVLRSRQVASTLHEDEAKYEKFFVQRTAETTRKARGTGEEEEEKEEEEEEDDDEEELSIVSSHNHRSRRTNGTHYEEQDEEGEVTEEEEQVLPLHNQNHRSCQEDRDAGVAIVALLKTCTQQKDLLNGSRIHADIVTRGLLETNVFVGSAVVNMYAKCGSLSRAQAVFDTLGVRNVVSWNALIAGYVQQEHHEEALNCFEQMQLEGISPNAITFVEILRACSSTGAVGKGQEIHVRIIKDSLLDRDVIVGTALVDFYARLGLLVKSQEVFDMISNPNVVSWTVLIGGYAYYGHGNEALNCFEQMQFKGFSPSAVTLIFILKACASIGAADMGQEIHSQIVKKGLLVSNMFVGTALVDMYAKCGVLVKAQEVCDELPFRDVVVLNALIAGYTQHCHGEMALQCFEQMQLEGLSPDRTTFACVLKACGSIGAIDKGEEIYTQIVTEGWLEKDNVICTAVVDMFAKCGLLDKAHEVFDKLPVQDVVSWNALITGYVQHGHGEEALRCYEGNCREGLYPDAITFVCILNACGSIQAAYKGEEIHAKVVKHGLLARDIVVANALIDMYAKCGLLGKAQNLLNNLSARDVVSWNTLITGFVHHGHDEDSLACFELMQIEGFSPDLVTFVCILKACGSMGAAFKGQGIYADLVKEGLLEKDLIIGTSLVDMYANCGMLAEAQEIFDKLSGQNVITWNALIAAYSQLGNAKFVFSSFNKMVREGIRPDIVTVTILLNTCSHTGLLDVGQSYFEIMTTCYGVLPTLEHHSCMVDLFCRAGLVDKAVALIKETPFSASLTILHTMLHACQKLNILNLAKSVFEHAMQLDEQNAAAYVCFENICVDAGRQEDGCMHHSMESEEASMQ